MKQSTSTNCIFPISDLEQVKDKVLNWAKQFGTFCFLDNHQYQVAPHSEECLLAAGEKRHIKLQAGNALKQLQEFINIRSDGNGQAGKWLFGHLGYDLKNEIEELSSQNPEHTGFPDLFFFEPEILIRFSEKRMIIEADDPQKIFKEIEETFTSSSSVQQPLRLQHRFSREEYIEVIGKLKRHIQRGDCYEINFCQEFYAADAIIDPVVIYKKLSEVSPNPFSALYRTGEQWLICASPERFLKKEGSKILSQPIKGTSKRVLVDDQQDEQSRTWLQDSAKDQSENVMVVDLVRNDLSRVCREGSVVVEELFGIYSFPQVHQMISTVSGELKKDMNFTDIIRATFPMGSMTGAPKRKVMELIEQYERTKRGIFSGAVGYISPGGDFDLNVVIRSIMYNAATQYLSLQAGSGITWYSNAEKEWEECLLKAEAIEEVLGNKKG
ncbi:MAG TPA: anthranilate synthase component I family protein [Chitinophagaceae bacterium]|nr:anthranilate synthase component I family protein [Chitinophagaceae bacterium]